MKTMLKAAMLAAAAIAAPVAVSAPAAAQQIAGIGIADLETAAGRSAAYTNAMQAMQTTYKTQLDAANAERNRAATQLKPLADKFNADRAGGKVPEAQLQTQVAAIQRIQAESQQREQQILQPVALSRAYVLEQINEQLSGAVKAAMAKKKITVLMDARSVIDVGTGYDVTPDITAELNRLFPAAQVVPPQGWLPREQREQQQAAAAARAQQAPAAPATPPASR